MGTKIIHCNSGENLAALLKAFPQADVQTLYAESGKDSWRLTIELPDPEIEVEVKPKATRKRATKKKATPRKTAKKKTS